jgi:uncharacterized membrane protein YvlD (DUF360 family)
MHPPPSLRASLARSGRVTEITIKHLIVWVAQAVVLLTMAGLFETIEVKDFADSMIVIVVAAAIGTLVMPTLIRYAVRLKPILFPVITFLLYAWALLILDQLLTGWRTSNWWVADASAGEGAHGVWRRRRRANHHPC